MSKEEKKKILKKRNENKPFYVDNMQMYEELKKYNETKHISEELGEMFLKIARKFTNKYSFSSYTYRDELISSAVGRMVEYVSKFDVNRPNPHPFCYFTQIAYNQIITVIKKEKQQSTIKSNCRDMVWDELSQEEQIKYGGNSDQVDDCEFFDDSCEKESI